MARRRKYIKGTGPFVAFVLTAVVLMVILVLFDPVDQIVVQDLEELELPDYVQAQLISVDGHSRRGTELAEVNSIVVHYVGNPGTTAQQNRDWYENPESTVSSHFLVGLEGEVIQCLPLNEMSSATGQRNIDTISIEVCHPDDSGKFNKDTYRSLVKLTAWLVQKCGLEMEDVIRHYDVTGKECPRYYVRNEDAWLDFKDDVAKRIG